MCFFNVKAQKNDEGKYEGSIYKECDVPEYILPDVLTTFDKKKVTNKKQWEKIRRLEIMKFFTENLYGKVPVPADPVSTIFEVISEDNSQMEGLCTRRDVIITMKNKFGEVRMPLVVFSQSFRRALPCNFLVSY